MEQISLPMRIALAVTLVFAAVWLVALRPTGASEAVDGPLPAVEQPKKADHKADATAKDSTPAAKTPTSTEPSTKSSTTKPSADKVATKAKTTGSKAVLADVRAGKTVVLLFWSMNGADDRAVKRAVAQVDRHDGKVTVHTSRMSDLPKYEAITKAAPVTTSPTVLVIDRQAQARTITGVTTAREIDLVVDRALKVK